MKELSRATTKHKPPLPQEPRLSFPTPHIPRRPGPARPVSHPQRRAPANETVLLQIEAEVIFVEHGRVGREALDESLPERWGRNRVDPRMVAVPNLRRGRLEIPPHVLEPRGALVCVLFRGRGVVEWRFRVLVAQLFEGDAEHLGVAPGGSYRAQLLDADAVDIWIGQRVRMFLHPIFDDKDLVGA